MLAAAMALMLQTTELPPVEPGLCWLTAVMETRLLDATRPTFEKDLQDARKGKPTEHSETEIVAALLLLDQERAAAWTVVSRNQAPEQFTDEFFKREDALSRDDKRRYVKLCLEQGG